MDYAAMNAVVREMAPALEGSRLFRAIGIGPMELVLELDTTAGKVNLLLSADVKASRIHIVDGKDIPKESPKLHICNMLNERDRGATLRSVELIEWERIVRFTISSVDIDGSEQIDILVAELMGKYSNIILLDQNEMILGSLKAIHSHQSSKRQVRAGLQYQLPPPEDKLTPKPYSLEDFSSLFKSANPGTPIGKLFVSSFKAISPSWAGIIVEEAEIEPGKTADEIGGKEIERLHKSYLQSLKKIDAGHPLDVEPAKGTFPVNAAYAGIYRHTSTEDLLGKRLNILKRIIRDLEKSNRKLIKQLERDVEASSKRDELKRRADALLAALHEIPKGAKKVELVDVHSPDYEKITIELDPAVPPTKQAAKWYARYNKLKRGEAESRKRLALARDKLEIIEGIKTEVETASDLEAIDASAARLEAAGLEVKFDMKGGVSSKPSARTYKVLRYRSSDAFDILAGGNQKANDYLTQRLADNEDIWLHAQKMPGSHVIIRTRRKNVPQSTLNEAAMIAAWHSDGREGSKVPIDYTKVKHVRKPPGAKAGYVTYKRQRTIRIDPDEDRVKRLAVKEKD